MKEQQDALDRATAACTKHMARASKKLIKAQNDKTKHLETLQTQASLAETLSSSPQFVTSIEAAIQAISGGPPMPKSLASLPEGPATIRSNPLFIQAYEAAPGVSALVIGSTA